MVKPPLAREGGEPLSEFYLNRKQAIFITAKFHPADGRALRVLFTLGRTSGPTGGRPTTILLSRKQATYITAKAQTAVATDITIEIIERFDAYERGFRGLPPDQPVLTPDDRSAVGGIIKRVIASQIRPLFQMRAFDHPHLVEAGDRGDQSRVGCGAGGTRRVPGLLADAGDREGGQHGQRGGGNWSIGEDRLLPVEVEFRGGTAGPIWNLRHRGENTDFDSLVPLDQFADVWHTGQPRWCPRSAARMRNYTNCAESSSAACTGRRSAITTHIAGAYLVRCAQESTWRDVHRRVDNGTQVRAAATLAMPAPTSVTCAGIGRGRERRRNSLL